MTKIKFSTLVAALAMTTMTSCGEKTQKLAVSENSVSEISQVENTEQTGNTERKEDVIIRVPSNSHMMVETMARDFESSYSGYKIEIVDYSEYYDQSEDENGAILDTDYNKDLQLCQDIIKGGKVDLIPNGIFADQGKYDSLAKKGAFADLYTFMENDDEVNRQTLNETVLKACETDGKLYSIPVNFSIDTLVGFPSYVGEKSNWTMNELMDKWNQMPEGSIFSSFNTKDCVYRDILRADISSFIDYDSGTTSFDSPEFVGILEFINTFDSPLGYKNDHVSNVARFVFPMEFDGFRTYHAALWNDKGEDYTFVGYPSEDGCGSFIKTNSVYSISAFSDPEVQYGAWLFIRDNLTYDTQYQYFKDTFPINNVAFEQLAKDEMQGEDLIYSHGGVEINKGHFNQEDYDSLKELLSTVTKKHDNVDDEIFIIIDDELSAMFDGTHSPQETAKMIQNRASILVSENY